MRASVYSASAMALLLLIQLPALCHAFSASRLPSLLHSRPVPALHKHSKHNFGGVQAARNNVCLKASAMQSDWEELVDEASGSTYYWNRVSGETSWEKPAASAPAAAAQGGLRGPFGAEDTFVLQDGRQYIPGDAATDSLYGAALAAPVDVDDAKKAQLAGALLGFSVLVPFLLVSLLGGS
eukprot:CAMPEP_0177716106 /NCGR_PEP_ID=MMETSP0484_2-20121128/14343_1 /TAXON_ID=354590 /ORGANISM="Rhodomonas lens, Strain RHODO" /LENGTH=180 /DNA_ID=CAMNT_0019228135 /DNA_START=56 /DNA_END=598 /DNA_ORIENTATION=-